MRVNIKAVMKNSSLPTLFRESLLGVNAILSFAVGNASEPAEESLFGLLEPSVHRVKMQLSGSETVNLGGITEVCLSSHAWGGRFLFFITSELIII